MSRPVSFTEQQTREAVAASRSYSEVLRRLGLRPAGGNYRTIRRYVDEVWQIATDHFGRAPGRTPVRAPVPLADVLVAGRPYKRERLKARLYREGLKRRACELCGQGEEWRGHRMTLILDHINGDADDNRIENLRILCPNCNATLETHCGRNKKRRAVHVCERCGERYRPVHAAQRFCSRACGRVESARAQRRVARPAYEVLRAEVRRDGFAATGRRYGVSDNAIRKWLRAYERERPPPDGRQASADRAPSRSRRAATMRSGGSRFESTRSMPVMPSTVLRTSSADSEETTASTASGAA